MTRNSRNILMATTLLAGFAIFTLDAAPAGPNSPSFSGRQTGPSGTVARKCDTITQCAPPPSTNPRPGSGPGPRPGISSKTKHDSVKNSISNVR
jgi:hypothetical protein